MTISTPTTYCRGRWEIAISCLPSLLSPSSSIESEIFSLHLKLTHMGSIWLEFYIMDFISRLWLMIFSLSVREDSLFSRSQQESGRYGLWCWRKSGRNCLDPMRILLEDCLKKFYMLLVRLLFSWRLYQVIPKNKKICGIWWYRNRKMVLCYAVAQRAIPKFKS